MARIDQSIPTASLATITVTSGMVGADSHGPAVTATTIKTITKKAIA
ncbi:MULTISPECIES: hypothetical protein [unclassified Cupriavidus]